jgi:hypothetical protein
MFQTCPLHYNLIKVNTLPSYRYQSGVRCGTPFR